MAIGGAPPATVALVLALSVAACSRGAPPERAATSATPPASSAAVRGDWLVDWALSDPESLNPLTSNDAASNAVLGFLMTSMLGLDPKTLEQIPVAATGLPEISADHLIYTFHLRPDVTFGDGTPATVDDVLFSLKAVKNPEVNAPFARNYFLSIVDARALDRHTIQFRCAEPYFHNDFVLGSMSILPRRFYDPDGDLDPVSVADLVKWAELAPDKKRRAERFAKQFNEGYHRRVLGGGAFVLKDPEHDIITGERIVLRHRDGFWAPGDALRGDAWVDRILFRVINNPDAALVALKAGTLDLMSLTPLQHLKQTGTPGFRARFKKEIAYTPTYSYIGWNELRPMFRETAVRRALARFIDRDRIIQKVLFGFGEKIDSPVYRFSQEYDTDIKGYEFDPELGRRELDEAGWIDSDGVRDKLVDGKRVRLRFEVISNSGNQIRKNVGLIVTDELRRAGVDATFRELDWSILLSRIENFDYDAVILGWQFSPVDPDLYQIWHSSQAVPGGSNHVAFKNAEADRILVEYRRTFDKQRRIQLYRRLQEIIHDEAPYAFLFMQKGISAVDRRFRNTNWYPTGGPLVNEWWVPLPEQRYGR